MRQQSEHEQVSSQVQQSKTLEKYKKNLLIQVIVIFTICLIVILERIFYQVIVQNEDDILSNFQSQLGLTKMVRQQVKPDGISKNFFQFFGDFSQFHIIFLIFTHFMATLYVGIDGFVATKIMYVSMAVIYLISLLQMFYGAQRPFWSDNTVLTSSCQQSYNHPSLGIILSLFIPLYTYYCFQKRSGQMFFKISKKKIALFILFGILIFLVQFTNYILGNIYLLSIATSFVFFILIWMIIISLNSLVDKIIKKSTILKLDAKKYVFYWLLLICLLQTFVMIVYSGEDVFLDIDWVKNFISCTKYLNYQNTTYRYDEVIGPWFNFLQTASVFAWIGAVFGISICFRKIDTIQWWGGSIKKKILRVIIINLMIIPSWLFILLLEDNRQWIKDIGLNQFIVDSIHYFILYFWIFGFMPILVLHKGLKLTNKDQEDYYVVLEDKK